MDDLRAKFLISKYDRSVPRYTSFPTAVQFHENLSDLSLEDRYAAIPEGESVSIYIHIPFCHSLCHYCGCNTKIVNSIKPIEYYVDTLLKEFKLIGYFLPKKLKVSRIHFGGGSPNYASNFSLVRIINTLSEIFDLDDDTDIDMECDPRLLNQLSINTLSRMELSRISLGIQDFDEIVQQAINRIQPFDHVKRNVEDIRSAGIKHINFDLITGLPQQTLDTVNTTLDKTIELMPNRIAVFPYAHVPWMKPHQKLLEKFKMPDSFDRFKMNMLVEERLTQAGYKMVGIDHFVREDDSLYHMQRAGTLRRNFQGYTDDTSDYLIGMGLSSISSLNDMYAQNTTDSPTYQNMVKNGELPLKRGLVLSAEDMRRRKLIERLMCDFKIDLNDYSDIKMPYDKLAPLEQDGLIVIKDNHLSVTDDGKSFTRIVAACFDPYLKIDGQNHAKAI